MSKKPACARWWRRLFRKAKSGDKRSVEEPGHVFEVPAELSGPPRLKGAPGKADTQQRVANFAEKLGDQGWDAIAAVLESELGVPLTSDEESLSTACGLWLDRLAHGAQHVESGNDDGLVLESPQTIASQPPSEVLNGMPRPEGRQCSTLTSDQSDPEKQRATQTSDAEAAGTNTSKRLFQRCGSGLKKLFPCTSNFAKESAVPAEQLPEVKEKDEKDTPGAPAQSKLSTEGNLIIPGQRTMVRVTPKTDGSKAEAAGASEVNDWQDKLTVSAVECANDGISYPPPPFPFKQRWHKSDPVLREGPERRVRVEENNKKYICRTSNIGP
ncbi:uncharacterized protein AB675_10796 [Cyphellophora attinorum]|uniref:Uncharacterized protein n=1 Tax=Cyphellophora attinorum TaxID=1664694 RepID=A0A0N0NMY5_9EURO|nr:uncharacterized protein AB675_10796 [Phialophora attinorum]KPI40888.1 hypothetical protein AB675_10796 [Phialophora attinorum]